MDPTPIALLSGAVASLSGVSVFLFLRLEKANEKKDQAQAAYVADLKAEHSQRIADKDKSTAAILAQSDRAHNLVERLTDVFEATSGKKIQP
jgi:hypothetical protein